MRIAEANLGVKAYDAADNGRGVMLRGLGGRVSKGRGEAGMSLRIWTAIFATVVVEDEIAAGKAE